MALKSIRLGDIALATEKHRQSSAWDNEPQVFGKSSLREQSGTARFLEATLPMKEQNLAPKAHVQGGRGQEAWVLIFCVGVPCVNLGYRVWIIESRLAGPIVLPHRTRVASKPRIKLYK